jgi:glycosyltransferase involved in cell wall biosynthesis
MALITFSVIIAAPELREEIPCWQSLRSNGFCPNETEPPAPAHSPLEVLIVSGQNPSAQRNAAVREAKGTWLVFLDSDCEIAPRLF